MNSNCKRLIFMAALIALVSASFGQGFRGRMGGGAQTPLMLLRRDDVKNDLKLTDDQKTKLLDLQDGIKSKMQAVFAESGQDRDKMMAGMKTVMDDATKQANAILTPEQQTRLKQIFIQISGFSAITSKDVQDDLKLSDAQRTKIADLKATADAANQSIGEKIRSQEIDQDTAMATFKKNTEALKTELGKVLTDDQKAKFKELGGPVFTADQSGNRL